MVCVYRDTDRANNHPDGQIVSGGDSEVGSFVDGGRVSVSEEMALLDAIAPGRPTVGCALQHQRFAVIRSTKGGGPYALVELGGCGRVLVVGSVPGKQPQTSQEVDMIGQATSQAATLIESAASRGT